MLQLIQSWLQSKDYNLGVEIYNRYGESSYLKRLFAGGPDSFNERKLESELVALLDTRVEAKPIVPSTKAAEVNKEPVLRPSDSPDAPVEIKTLVEKRKSLYAKTRVAKDELSEMYVNDEEPNERSLKLALSILDYFDEIKELWDLTNFYDKHLRLPETVETTIDLSGYSVTQLNKMYYNNYKYINKNKSDTTKTSKVKERIQQSSEIATLLQKQDAFMHDGLQIFTIENIANNAK